MKTIVCLIILALPLMTRGQSINNQLVVYGEGTIDSPADRGRISFSVVGFGPSIEKAMAAARSKLSTISKRLFSLGLNETNLLTSSFYSGDNTQGKAFLSSSKDFRTQMDVLVTVDSLRWLEGVIVVLASSEVERLSNISFTLKSDSLLKVQSREQAVASAHEKARRMAEQLGIQLGRVIYLEEIFGLPRPPIGAEPYYSIQRNMTSTVRIEDQGIAFYGGQRFSVNSFVKVVFEIK